MDNQRLLFFAVFAISLYFLWTGWQNEQAKLRAPQVAAQAIENPALPQDIQKAPGDNASPKTIEPQIKNVPSLPPVTVTTDLYEVSINPVGGVIEKMALLKQPSAEDKTKPYLVMQNQEGRYLVAQSGFASEGLPNHYTTYQITSQQLELKEGEDRFDLHLQATADNNDVVEQIFTFHRNSYVIDVTYKVTNKTATEQSPVAYFQFKRDKQEVSKRNAMAPAAYVGAAVFDKNDNFKKVDFKAMDKIAADPVNNPLPYTAKNNDGWVAMIEHYFVTAWALPKENETERTFFTKAVGEDKYTAGMQIPLGVIAPQQTASLTVPLYAGPQDQDVLSQLAPSLNLVVDYGIFTVIAKPMFWLVNFFYRLIGNWGWAIIAMTILIRLVFYPLNAAAARSMAKMKIIAPKMKLIQEEFKEDKQQMQVRMMELYKKEKINPLGGCLPILIQMPFFIALYWVLLSAAELRYAPWFLWIQDLSQPDPYFILPALYAVSAFLQMKLSPTPVTDPAQAKMMQMLPVVFAVLFVFFPSGLVLYWFVSNLFQIGQQWYVNRMLEREAAKRNAS
ncbi:MAG: membrane protein insertase YidC [Burkholderiales bacterium]|jgi:YidC/Oxa1 family membrane protein insertase|nr:membrane protein insertase YidC [Burkholderiales bacterium]